MGSLKASSRGEELDLQIKSWFIPPVFPNDEDKTRRAKLLNLVVIYFFVFIPFIIISNLIGGNTSAIAVWVGILALITCIILFYWLRHGRIDLASFGIIALGLVGTTLTVASLGTIRAPATALYLLMVITAGLLFELRGMIATTAISSLLVGGLIIAGNMGLLPAPNYSITITQWINYTLFFGWAGSLTFTALQSMHSALDLTKNEIERRRRAEEDLTTHRDHLEELVKEGTAELEAKSAKLSEEITERKRTEEILKKSEEKYRKIFEDATVGIFQTSIQGRILVANLALAKMFGFASSEEMITQITDLGTQLYAHSEDRERLKRLLAENETVENFEARGQKKDGQPIWVSMNTRAARDQNGFIQYLEGTCIDITERKRTEEALQKSENLYRSLFDNMLNGFAYCQMHLDDNDRPWDFTYLSVNSSFEMLTGLRNVVGKRVTEVIPGIRESDPELLDIYGRVSKTGKPERFEMFVEALQMWFWISVYSPARGNFVAVFDVITERKRTEKALQESEARFRGIFENNSAAMAIIERDTTISMVNKEYCKLGLFEKEDVIGISWTSQIPPEDLGRLLEYNRKRLIDPKSAPDKYEFSFYRKDDRIRYCLMSVAIIPISGQIVCSFIDITERKLAEETLKSNLEELKKSRREIQQSNSLLESVMASPKEIVIFALDREYRYLAFNQNHKDTMKAIWGVDIELGRSMLEYIKNPEDCDKAKRNFDRALSGEHFILDEVYGDEVLQRRYYEDRYSPIFENDGSIIGLTVFLTDITERTRVEKALQESETRYRTLFEAGMDSIYLFPVKADGLPLNFTDVNAVACQAYGYTRDEFLTMSPSDLIAPEYHERMPALGAMLTENRKMRAEWEDICKDGHRIPVDVSVTIFDLGGQPTCMAVVRDITERKRAEEDLKESEEKYRNLVERANDGIAIIQDGTVRYTNPALAKIWGGSVEEIFGRQFTDFIDPDEIPKVAERYQRRMANESVTSTIYETILRRRDGSKLFAELNAGLITFQGTPADLVIIRDITERKAVEEKLVSLMRFQNELLDTASVWIDIFDAKGNTTFWNLAAERISGYSREEVLDHAKMWKWLYPDPEYRAKMIDDVKGVLLKNERLENYETIICVKGGGQKVISWHSSNFVDEDGKIMGGIGIGVDITEKKEIENELKESERRLADIVDFLPDATMVIDNAGRVISWNQAIVKMTGVKAEDILGKGDYEYAIPFYGQRRPVLVDMVQKPLKELEINYSNIKRQGGILVGEAYIPNLNGREAYLLGTAAALYDFRGNIVGAIESIRDITERKRIEDALKAERDRAEQYLNTIEVILVALDTEARITLLNRKGYQVLGYEEDELIGKDWIKTCLRPQDHEAVHEANRKIVSGKIKLFEYYESYILNKNGEERSIAWHTTIIKNKEGGIIGTLSSGEDITERKKAEEKILQLAAIVESSNDAIFGSLLDGTITNWNKGAEKIYGYTENEIIGQPVTLLASPERLDEVPRILELLRQEEHIDHHESLCRRKDGEQFPVDLTISPIYDIKGRITGISSIVRDITERKKAEKALKDSEKRLATIIEFLPDATLVIDNEKKVIAWNRAIEEMTGVSKDNMIGKGDYAYTIPFYGERRKQLLDLLDLDDKELALKYKYVQRTGGALYAETFTPALYGGKGAYVLAAGASLFDNEGSRIGAIESIRDITEFKKAERSQREQLSFLQQLIDSIPNPIFYKDTKGVYLGCNAAFEAITGYSKDKIVGYTVYELYPKEFADIYYEADNNLFQNPGVQIYEASMAHTDGSRHDVMFNKAAYFDTEGRLAGLVGVILDITERKHMEIVLQESKDYLDKIINTIGDPLFVKDRSHKFVLVNDALCNMMGKPYVDIIGRTDQDFFPKEQVEIFLEKDEKVFITEKENVNEEEFTDAQGIIHTIITKKTLYKDNTGNKSIVGIIRDITDRKQAEDRIKASLKEKEILLKEVHHRVKNNLGIISALLSLQSSYLADEDIIKIFRDSQNRIKSMALVHENLYRSKDLDKVDFTEYINQLVSHLSQSYGDLAAKIKFKVNLENIYLNINTAIPCGMIINELISNSFKHAFPDGRSGEVHIDLSSEDDGFRLVVSDNGVGIKGDLNIKESKTLGFRLIDTLVKQIHGEMKLDTINGTRCEIHFKGLK